MLHCAQSHREVAATAAPFYQDAELLPALRLAAAELCAARALPIRLFVAGCCDAKAREAPVGPRQDRQLRVRYQLSCVLCCAVSVQAGSLPGGFSYCCSCCFGDVEQNARGLLAGVAGTADGVHATGEGSLKR